MGCDGSRPKGAPEADHFTMVEFTVPELGDCELLIKTDYWSIDPAMRGWTNETPNYIPNVELGAVMRSLAVGKESPAGTSTMLRVMSYQA